MKLPLWQVFRLALKKFGDDDGFPLAGNIAFSTILSFFPFLIFVVATAGFLGNEQLAADAVSYLLQTMPTNMAEPLAREIETLLLAKRDGLLTISVLGTIWTASSGVRSVRVGMNRAYDCVERRPFWKLVLWDVAFVVIGALTMLTLSVFVIAGSVLWAKLTTWIPYFEPFTALFFLIRYPIALFFMVSGLLIAHWYLPPVRRAFLDLLPGIFFTLLLWLSIAFGFAQYVAMFDTYTNTYAGLAGIMLALMFFYLFAAATLFGAQLNQAILDVRDNSADTNGNGKHSG